jgi:hypothetical protein
MMACGWLKLGK